MPEIGIPELLVAVLCGIMLWGPILMMPWITAQFIKSVRKLLDQNPD